MMNNPTPAESPQSHAFWDIFVLKEDGRWLGMRAPWKSFRRVVTLLTLLFALSSISFTGWMLSRWQSGRLDRLLSLERLKSMSLENQVADLRKSGGAGGGKVLDVSAVSVLPALSGEELTSGSVSFQDSQVGYDSASHEFHMNFEVVRPTPHEGIARFYWVLLLHGPQGVFSYPPTFGSRAGEVVQFHRGQLLDDVKIRRSVSARFKISEFLENAGTEPVYATLALYDTKGSLVLKRRHEIVFQRADKGDKESP